MKLLFYGIVLITYTTIFAQDSNENEDFLQQSRIISIKYERGSRLLYDCKDEHWVCTREEEFNRCARQRKKAILDMNNNLPCAYFKKYSNQKECQKAQIEQINLSSRKSFCLRSRGE